MKEDLKTEIESPEGVNCKLDSFRLTISGSKGEVSRGFAHPKISLNVEGKKIVFFSKKASKKEKAVMGSFVSHTKNMIKGVQDPHIYKLKICSGHFPMNVSVSGADFVVKNFLGESVPRRAKVVEGTNVKINGTEIVVSSPDKEAAGQMAARIEKLCEIKGRDKRIFMDGCYIIHKAGKDI